MIIKKLVTITLLTVASWLMLGVVVFVGLGVYGGLAEVQEDDKTFNCWMMGNARCGEGAVWHGFVNL